MIPFALALFPSLRSAPLYALTSAVLPTEQRHPAGRHRRLNPLYYAAFINSRGPRSGVATGDPICTAYKVSSN